MGGQSSENYLDNLLNSVNGFGTNKEENTDEKKADGDMYKESEEDFLRQFESELEEDAYDDYILDFENEMQREQGVKTDPYARETEGTKVIADDDESLEDMLAEMEKISADDSFEELKEDKMDVDDEDMESLDKLNSAVDAFDMELEESGIGEESDDLDFGFSDTDLESLIDNSSDNLDGLNDSFDTESAEDKSGNGSEGVVAGIENIPSDAVEDIAPDDIDDIFKDIPDIDDMGDYATDDDSNIPNIEDEMEPEEIKAAPVYKEEVKEPPKKLTLLDRIKLLLFGEDEEEELDANGSLDGIPYSEITKANKDIFDEMTPKDNKKEKKEKKKKEKEKKPKEKKAKKPKKQKPPKPKKEKKPKEKDTSPPLPKVPVLMIVIMVASLVGLVLLGTNLTSYTNGVKQAEILYNEGQFSEAYEQIKGLSVKESDMEKYNKISTMACISSKYESYCSFYQYGKKDVALDNLVCAAGRCEINKSNAKEYDCEIELETLRVTIENELKDKYNMTIEDARELYKLRNRTDYTIALQKKLVDLGVD